MTIEDDIDAQVRAALASSIPANSNVNNQTGKTSDLHGGKGGEEFDDGFHKHISKITIKSGQVIDSISMIYDNGTITTSHGGDGGEESSLELKNNEYIIQVNIRAGKIIQSLTFRTNLGRVLACGGKGGLLLGGFKGKEIVESCPDQNYGLVGIKGRKGK